MLIHLKTGVATPTLEMGMAIAKTPMVILMAILMEMVTGLVMKMEPVMEPMMVMELVMEPVTEPVTEMGIGPVMVERVKAMF